MNPSQAVIASVAKQSRPFVEPSENRLLRRFASRNDGFNDGLSHAK